jgi:hypothetical protein
MNYVVYDGIVVSKDFSRWDFTGIGKKGSVCKQVSFSCTGMSGIYNLAFGDLDENGKIDDRSVSDNGDRDKVLATVVKIVTDYTAQFPDRWIHIKGSTESRTRLYRMAIGINLEELSIKFDIFGLVGKKWIPFAKDLNVRAFLITIKKP